MLKTIVPLCFLLCIACTSKQQGGEAKGSEQSPSKEKMVEPETKSKDANWREELSTIDKVVYRFQDASVPPPSHRSFTITVTPAKISKVVDSYGDIISEQENAISAEQFQKLLQGIAALDMDAARKFDDDGPQCTGGTSVSLTLSAQSRDLLSGSISSCGGKDTGSLVGDVKAVARLAGELLQPSADK